jgi:hypothetical protein
MIGKATADAARPLLTNDAEITEFAAFEIELGYGFSLHAHVMRYLPRITN